MNNRNEIPEGDKLIAEFLGWWQDSDQPDTWFKKLEYSIAVAYSIHSNYPHRDLPFHRSWEWIMSVVAQIEGMGISFSINTGDVDLNWMGGENELYPYISKFHEIYISFDSALSKQDKPMADSKLDAVWKACVEFIKFVNENIEAKEYSTEGAVIRIPK